ncbi:MAG TPA: sorbosone dehydrogenase family protein [Thermoanaerobaculia bacterium]|nr:sorbosone dehydrogenase family protein [Thermoanaerobaculia bacterium]
MRTAISLGLIALLACSRGVEGERPVPPAKADETSALLHHEVRADRLPAPYATPSAATVSRQTGSPRNARFVLPPRFSISLWAEDLPEPRNMIQAPNGDVLVACMSGREIDVLRDADGDGKAEKRWVFHDGLNRPFGLALRGNHLYAGNTDAVVRFDYKPGQTTASGEPVTIAPLPRGGHATRNLLFNRDGSKLYVSIGSASNVDDETDDPRRAAIMEMNPDGSGRRIFASGLRNPIGLAWNPANRTLWTVVNERDGLGDELVPDYITEVKAGAFYGWPFSYIGKNVDPRRRGERPDLVAKAIPPSLLFASHSAPITLAFYNGTMFPEKYRGGAFVALHGSWNREKLTGYEIVHVPFRNGQPAGGYDDFVLGWIAHPDGREVYGRPAGVLVLRDGSLLIADDGANVIWRVTYR